MNVDTSVVILRSGHHGGLGIVRSLGRLGIPVYTIDAQRWEPAFASRYCRGRSILDTASVPAESAIPRLLEIGRRIGGRPLLIPATDQTTIWVADHAAALEPAFRFPRQDPALVRLLCDKSRMQELARRNGVPTPSAVYPRSSEDIERFLEGTPFPVIAKATDADRFRGLAGATKVIVHTRPELLALYAKVEDPVNPPFLIQELIPGEDWMFDGYFDRGSACLFGITGKKIRRFPVNTGVTSLGICLDNQTVAETTARFMQAIGYHGILDIGYRYDRRDGTYKVLDVNPRIGCTFRLFTSAGGDDVARALYLDMTGQTVSPSQIIEGRKWIVEDFDLISSFRSLTSRTVSLKDWLRSFRGIQEAACFAWDDPLPFLMMAVADCGELAQWLRGRKHAQKAAAGSQQSPSSASAS
jgi:predicted ATP-grasp superfamily ATP-dependent carboligase